MRAKSDGLSGGADQGWNGVASVLSDPGKFTVLLAVLALYYLFLLSNGTFQIFAPEMFDKAFGSMLEHLLRGEFTVDPAAINSSAYSEAWVRNGRTYSYFGILPALLRLAAMPFTDVAQADLARLSCLAAVVIYVALQLRMLLAVHHSLPAATQAPGLLAAMIAATALSGPQIYILATGWIYHEPILWAAAVAAGFNLVVLRAALARGLGGRELTLLAMLAGLALLARPTVGVALYLGAALLIAWTALRPWAGGGAAPTISAKAAALARLALALACDRRLALPIAILAVFAAVAGVVNFGRWGDPFAFADYRYATYGKFQDNALAVLHDYGEFNFGRLWIGALYYATGAPWLLKHAPPFAEFLHARYQSIEAPAITPLLTNPLTVALAAFGLYRLWRRPEPCATPEPGASSVTTLRLALIGHASAVLLIFLAMALALRYRFDLAPFMTLAALVGYRAVSMRAADLAAAARRRLRRAAAAMCVIGILGSHYVLILYKVWSMGVPLAVRRALLPFSPVSPF